MAHDRSARASKVSVASVRSKKLSEFGFEGVPDKHIALTDLAANISECKFDYLYTDTNDNCAALGEMADGSRVDAVIVYRKEDTEKSKQLTVNREIFLQNLSGEHYEVRIAQATARLQNAAQMSPEDVENLMTNIEIHKKKLEFSRAKLEREESNDRALVFVKLHMPPKALAYMAEIMGRNLPLAQRDADAADTLVPAPSPSLFQQLLHTAPDNPATTRQIYARFSWDMRHKFQHAEAFDNGDVALLDQLFSPAIRSSLAYRLLERTAYSDDNDPTHTGIDQLLFNGAVAACYPLHDGPARATERANSDVQHGFPIVSTRQQLAANWATFFAILKPQPIHTVREYFGETIAFYFVWLGFYATALIIPALVGIAVFIYGLASFESQPDVGPFCTSNLTMCAICETCDKWELSQACTAYKVNWIFDNDATLFFSVFMSLWATVFLDIWKRNSAHLAFQWDVRHLSETEPQRPQFITQEGAKRVANPITGVMQRYFPSASRIRRMIVTGLVFAVMAGLVVLSVVGIVLFRLAVRKALFNASNERLHAISGVLTSGFAAILSVFVMVLFSVVRLSFAMR